jgi:hypothetical protein
VVIKKRSLCVDKIHALFVEKVFLSEFRIFSEWFGVA